MKGQEHIGGNGKYPSRQEASMHFVKHRPHPGVRRFTGKRHIQGVPQYLIEHAQQPEKGPWGALHPGPKALEGPLRRRAEVFPLEVTG